MKFINVIVMTGNAMLPNLDVDLLKTFAVLAETGNFTRTAEEVGRTQSAVSMQVKRLEDLVGKPLLSARAGPTRSLPMARCCWTMRGG
jgi:molybdenum-dependent DNA-binding transcriptional regulator ModE